MNSFLNSLHEQALAFAKEYLTLEHKLIDVLQKIDDCKLYLKLGYSSLFQYCLNALRLSESQSYYFTTVSRKAKEVPELKKAIERGEINVSKARRIVPVINQQNKDIWIERAKVLPQRELEFQVAQVNPRSVKEKVKPVSIDRLELTLSISKELNKKLEEVKNIVSQKKSTPVNLEEVLLEMTELYLEKYSPVRKAERVLSKKDTQIQTSQQQKSQAPSSGRPAFRQPIPAQMKHQINLRDKNQCTYMQNNQRCSNQRWLHVHHIKPVAQGGGNSVQNLTTLCSGHHRVLHNTPSH